MTANEEREPPKVFGRPMIPAGNGRWLLNIGLLTLVAECYVGGYTFPWRCEVMGQPYMAGNDMLSNLDEAIEWLEFTARRIMRECIEIAGPMVAVEELSADFGRYLPEAYRMRYPVRFK